ncbi:MAG: cyclic nucleotide-binding domain-containing protein [Verrucomicrobiota bacterium]
MSPSGQELYRVRDIDNMVYGPVDLNGLIQWIQEKRVLPETLIHVEAESRWHQAQDYAPLQKYFSSQPEPAPGAVHLDRTVDISPEELRQFPMFSNLSHEQLQQLAALSYSFEVAPGKLVVKQGEPCDAIYFVLSGALRVRLLAGEKNETTLRRIYGGEFFGEVGMFLQSTRMADVVADTKARLLRISSNTFQKLIKETPELAGPLLFSLAATMAQHMAEDHRKSSRGMTSELRWH